MTAVSKHNPFDDLPTVTEVRPLPKEVTVLFMETSDQYGKSEPVGVYSNIAFAMKASEPLTSRWYTKTFVLDGPPVPPTRLHTVTTISITPGMHWCIVYDWTKTADEIRAHARSISATVEKDGETFWLVEWHGLGRMEGYAGIGNVYILREDELGWFVDVVHEAIRQEAG